MKIGGSQVTIRDCGKTSNFPCEVEIRGGDEVMIKGSLQKYYEEGLKDRKKRSRA